MLNLKKKTVFQIDCTILHSVSLLASYFWQNLVLLVFLNLAILLSLEWYVFDLIEFSCRLMMLNSLFLLLIGHMYFFLCEVSILVFFFSFSELFVCSLLNCRIQVLFLYQIYVLQMISPRLLLGHKAIFLGFLYELYKLILKIRSVIHIKLTYGMI